MPVTPLVTIGMAVRLAHYIRKMESKWIVMERYRWVTGSGVKISGMIETCDWMLQEKKAKPNLVQLRFLLRSWQVTTLFALLIDYIYIDK